MLSSEQSDGTSFTPYERKLCLNDCGFFGTVGNMGLCSKCYRDMRGKDHQAASAKAAMEKSQSPKQIAQISELAAVVNVAAEPFVGSGSGSSQQFSVGSGNNQAAAQPKGPTGA